MRRRSEKKRAKYGSDRRRARVFLIWRQTKEIQTTDCVINAASKSSRKHTLFFSPLPLQIRAHGVCLCVCVSLHERRETPTTTTAAATLKKKSCTAAFFWQTFFSSFFLLLKIISNRFWFCSAAPMWSGALGDDTHTNAAQRYNKMKLVLILTGENPAVASMRWEWKAARVS